MLEETGTPYKLIPINLSKGEQNDPAFLKINPNGKIPAIVDRDGPDGEPLTLAELGAILFYLAEKTGRFLSGNQRIRLATSQWIMFQMSHVGPMIGQLHHFMSAAPSGNEYAIERYRKEGERLMEVLDRVCGTCSTLRTKTTALPTFALGRGSARGFHTTKQSLGVRQGLTRWFETIEQRPRCPQSDRDLRCIALWPSEVVIVSKFTRRRSGIRLLRPSPDDSWVGSASLRSLQGFWLAGK